MSVDYDPTFVKRQRKQEETGREMWRGEKRGGRCACVVVKVVSMWGACE